MLSTNPFVPMCLHSKSIDMRKSFDGLLGSSSMFINNRHRRIKKYYWNTDCAASCVKRFKEGYFLRLLRCADGKHAIDAHADPTCILSGIDLSPVWKLKRSTASRQTNLRENIPHPKLCNLIPPVSDSPELSHTTPGCLGVF